MWKVIYCLGVLSNSAHRLGLAGANPTGISRRRFGGLLDRATSSFLTMHAIAPVVFLVIAVLAVMLAVAWF